MDTIERNWKILLTYLRIYTVIIISNLQYWFKESNKCYLTIIFIQHNRKDVLRSCARRRLTSFDANKISRYCEHQYSRFASKGRIRLLGPLTQRYVYINSNKYRRKCPCYLPPSGCDTYEIFPMVTRRFIPPDLIRHCAFITVITMVQATDWIVLI